jgi:hypothetical protein
VEEIMKQLSLGIIVAIGLTLPAFADPPRLRGDYAFTYTDFCLQSTSGFNANLTPLAGPVNAASTGATGFEHFNGDGTGTVQIISNVAITLASTPLGSSAIACCEAPRIKHIFQVACPPWAFPAAVNSREHRHAPLAAR